MSRPTVSGSPQPATTPGNRKDKPPALHEVKLAHKHAKSHDAPHDASHDAPEEALRASQRASRLGATRPGPSDRPHAVALQSIASGMVHASAKVIGLQRAVRSDGHNPAIRVSPAQVRDELTRLRAQRAELARPLLILNGYRGFSGLAYSVRDLLVGLTSRRRQDIVVVSYATLGSVPSMTSRILDRARRAWGIDAHASESPEIDILGISMGGVLARWVSASASSRREIASRVPVLLGGKQALAQASTKLRLDAAHIYTFASPHRGAILADSIAPDPAAKLLRTDSPWLAALHDLDATRTGQARRTRVVPYTMLRDGLVGARQTAPLGMDPIWMPGPRWASHFLAARSEVFLIDVARRLRGETPLLPPEAANPPPRD